MRATDIGARGNARQDAARLSGGGYGLSPAWLCLDRARLRPLVVCRVARLCCSFERGVQVVPEVVDMFAADAQAQEPGGQVALSGEFAAPFDGGFDAAQAGGVDDKLYGV